ncbi:MAG: element excision factor XisH family protein, partial [Nostoc sp.]
MARSARQEAIALLLSIMKDLEEALGQFVLYAHLLKRYYPKHILYLAVSEDTRKRVFEEEAGQT